MKLGIATGRSYYEASYALKRFGIENLFDAMTTMDDVKKGEREKKESLRKPHPFSLIKTAQAMGVNRADPVSSIYGGARYLRKLWDALAEYDMPFWDRWFLALAAYNQGPAHLQDAVALAERLKGDGGSWGNVKSVFPLLAKGEYAARAKYGACRGTEAVNFVENVRYYYYVLNGLVVLDRPEAEHLAPLLAINAGGSNRSRSGGS